MVAPAKEVAERFRRIPDEEQLDEANKRAQEIDRWLANVDLVGLHPSVKPKRSGAPTPPRTLCRPSARPPPIPSLRPSIT